jgi:hypothetical protein
MQYHQTPDGSKGKTQRQAPGQIVAPILTKLDHSRRSYVPTTIPPSTRRTVPEMKDASSDARNR